MSRFIRYFPELVSLKQTPSESSIAVSRSYLNVAARPREATWQSPGGEFQT